MNYQTYLKKTSGVVAIMLTLAMSFSPILVHAATFDAGHVQTSGAPSTAQNHTFTFNLPADWGADDSMKIWFKGVENWINTPNSEFTYQNGMDYTDIDVIIGGQSLNLAEFLSGAPTDIEIGFPGPSYGAVINVIANSSVPTKTMGTSVVIKLGTNATSGDKQIINPINTGTAEIDVEITTGNDPNSPEWTTANGTEDMTISAAVPEVGTIVLFGASIIGLWFMMNEMKKHQSSGFAV